MSPALDLLVFGAHPDDIEFGCGGIIAAEAARGRVIHFILGSRGESGSQGTPTVRTEEAGQAARLLGASLEFIDLGGDAHFEATLERRLFIARLLRQYRPQVVLAPTLDENQHPDHAVLARLVRDAARLARYGGVAELRDLSPHGIASLLHYAITSDLGSSASLPLLVDVSPYAATWTAAMSAHASQSATRNYVELQLNRARLYGARAGVELALPLWPSDPVVIEDLSAVSRTARRF